MFIKGGTTGVVACMGRIISSYNLLFYFIISKHIEFNCIGINLCSGIFTPTIDTTLT